MDFEISRSEDCFLYNIFLKTHETKIDFLIIKSRFGQENANQTLKSWIVQIKELLVPSLDSSISTKKLQLKGNLGFECNDLWITITNSSVTILTKFEDTNNTLILQDQIKCLELLIETLFNLIDIEYKLL